MYVLDNCYECNSLERFFSLLNYYFSSAVRSRSSQNFWKRYVQMFVLSEKEVNKVVSQFLLVTHVILLQQIFVPTSILSLAFKKEIHLVIQLINTFSVR